MHKMKLRKRNQHKLQTVAMQNHYLAYQNHQILYKTVEPVLWQLVARLGNRTLPMALMQQLVPIMMTTVIRFNFTR